MATVSRGLPEQPHLDVPKREARDFSTFGASSAPMRWKGSGGGIRSSRTLRPPLSPSAPSSSPMRSS